MKTLAKTFGKKKGQKIYDLFMNNLKENPVLEGFEIQNDDVSDEYIKGEFAYVANDSLAIQVTPFYRADGFMPELSVTVEVIHFKDGKGQYSRDWETLHEETEDFDLESETFDDVNKFIDSAVKSVVGKTSIKLPGLTTSLSGASLYLACEFDQWRSNDSRVIQGIFSTEEKAIKALTKLYGKLEKDSNGGELGFVPVNNPNDVTLQVVKATLDEV